MGYISGMNREQVLLRTPATWGANTTVRSRYVDRPAKRPVRGVGCANPKTKTTSAALPMWNGCGSGANTILGMGDARPLRLDVPGRYKIP